MECFTYHHLLSHHLDEGQKLVPGNSGRNQIFVVMTLRNWHSPKSRLSGESSEMRECNCLQENFSISNVYLLKNHHFDCTAESRTIDVKEASSKTA